MGTSGMLTGRVYWTCRASGFGGDGTFAVNIKPVNITTAEKCCFFHHTIFFSLAQLKNSDSPWNSPPPSLQSLDFWRQQAGALVLLRVWIHYLEETLGKHLKLDPCSTVNVWNTDTCRQRASCHSWTGKSPPSTPQKLIPTSHAQQLAQAGIEFSHDDRHEDQELSLHGDTAAWVFCSLKASGSQPGPRNFPPYKGNYSVFWISAKTAGINCARKTNLLYLEKRWPDLIAN